jgi:Di-haem cytochrome c peroxidase
MSYEHETQSPLVTAPSGDYPPSKPARRNLLLGTAAGAMAACLILVGVAAADDDNDNPVSLREYIGHQVGGLANLKVPARDQDLPLPRAADGTVPYRYEQTEAKRYLGKLLFHDPIRTTRIDINGGQDGNAGQPKDLPAGSSFGGTLNATDPLIQKIFPNGSTATGSEIQHIVASTKQTGSCGSCHIGEAAGKAGQQINFNVGGEGRGYTDEHGNFFPRRRPQSDLVKLRTELLYPGDLGVDALPTLSDIWVDHGVNKFTTPSYFYHAPNPPGVLDPAAAVADPNLQLLATGRLDQLDSVGRTSPSMVGFAFNNRLLLGGFAGEPQLIPGTQTPDLGSLNPNSDPAQENLTLLLLDAHRMLNFQAIALRANRAFVKLFRDAFPQEAAADTGDLTTLISDDTVLRATSTFLRTTVTRNTAFDRFLAGDNRALTPRQIRGAKLFFTPAANGGHGAGCFSCHSGPILNKQLNDPDITGVGKFVEENFINVGIGDHPIQALNALARGHLDPAKLGKDGFPYHAEDNGRQEITSNASDAFKFRVLTMRQLKDGRNFMHNGSFTKLRDVVEYFNAGVPQDPTAGAAPTLSTRFTNPRGTGYPSGLGLSEEQVDDLTDFLENALYDPALVRYDPKSTTDSFQPNEHDLTYSKYHPELIALGAKDGFLLSLEAVDDNDHLSRRDQGLEFLDVTSQTHIHRIGSKGEGGSQTNTYEFTNVSSSVIDTQLLIVVKGLARGIWLENASGTTSTGDPYIRVYLKNGILEPNQSIARSLVFRRREGDNPSPVEYSLDLLSGQGNP